MPSEHIKQHLQYALGCRHTAKAYSDKRITAEDWAILQDSLRLAPSSTNLQPWQFIVADDEAGKARIAKAATGANEYNRPKILHASHVVVICSKLHADAAHVTKVVDKEDADGRYSDTDKKQQGEAVKRHFLGMHQHTLNDEAAWHARQCYIAMGFLLLTAANLGIDATPIEGVDSEVLGDEFGLSEDNMTALAVVALGYRSDADFNADLPKSRLSEAVVFRRA